MDNKVRKKYLRQVRQAYRGDKEIKKQFLQDVEDALLCYAESHPNCTYDDIVHKFGTPDELRESFSFASSDMLKKRNILLYRFVLTSAVLVTVLAILFTVNYVTNSYDRSKGYYIEDIKNTDIPATSPQTPNLTPSGEYTFD